MTNLDPRELLAIGHDLDDPLSELNRLEACWLAVSIAKSCPHCRVNVDVMPMSGNGWAVHHGHEPECPDHDDGSGDG